MRRGRESGTLASAMTTAPRTILFTDLVGFTALTQSLGDARSLQLLRRHNVIVRRALAEHGGREVKHTGDGIMAAFQSSAAALSCAVDIQRAFASAAMDQRLRVRIGVHAGTAIVEDGDYHGVAVLLAARLTEAAGPGSILTSEAVRALAEHEGFRFGRRKRARCKGFAGRVSAWEVAWSQPAWAPADSTVFATA